MNPAKPTPSQAEIPDAELAAREKYFTYLVRTLQEPDGAARAQAARILGESREARAVNALGAALGDPDPEVRQQAAQALGRIGEPALEPLVRALDDPDVTVRYWTAKALGHMDDDRVVAPLMAALRDAQDVVRSQAAFGLSHLGARAVEPLIQALRHPDANLRLQAARVLGQIGDPRALPELDRAGKDERSLARGTSSLVNVGDAARQAAEKIRARAGR